jgi:glycosyltransferase involved in cell wall biosynthesis
MKPKLLFIYDYFYPAYQAGGIVQSLFNLEAALKDKFDIKFICSTQDLSGEKIDVNKYLGNGIYINKAKIISTLKNVDKAQLGCVYLNGIFSLSFFLIPLLYFRVFYPQIKIAIAPRGMLQGGALSIRSSKKNLYLKLLKTAGLLNKVTWHATDEQEILDIKKVMGAQANCVLAYNLPKKPLDKVQIIEKNNSILRLVFLSLITEKKNLNLILQALQSIPFRVELDIYGPIKDHDYWKSCQKISVQLPANCKVSYKGSINPVEVQNTLQQYHAFVLPSKGENFGHAIYEALSIGRPVIISEFTPWNELKAKAAGWNSALTSQELYNSILELKKMSQDEFNLYCENALIVANKYYALSKNLSAYEILFKAIK